MCITLNVFKFISFIKEEHKNDKWEKHQISKFCIVGGDSRNDLSVWQFKKKKPQCNGKSHKMS